MSTLSARLSVRSLTLQLLVVAFATLPASGQTHLQVQSATVDLEHHQADIDLFNGGDKTVAAYTIRVEEFDANGNFIFTKVTGRDNSYYPLSSVDKTLQPGEAYLIHPGEAFTDIEALRPETVAVKASIVSVVNEDRTIEGDRKNAHLFFLQRAENTKELKQCLALLKTYPATPQDLSRTLQSLRSREFGYTAMSLLVTQLHLSAQTYNALIDKKQALPEIGSVTKDQWNTFVAELSKAIGFSELQSQENVQ